MQPGLPAREVAWPQDLAPWQVVAAAAAAGRQPQRNLERHNLVGHKMDWEGLHQREWAVAVGLRSIRLVRHTEAVIAEMYNLMVDLAGILDWLTVDIEMIVERGIVVTAAALVGTEIA